MSDFSPSIGHCRRAYTILANRLPSGFLTDGFCSLWTDTIRSGMSGTRGPQQRLIGMLPPADHWPLLHPSCANFPGESPAALFLRSLDLLAYAIRDEEGASQVIGAMPFRAFEAVEDQHTGPGHLTLNDTVRRHDDPFWSVLTTERQWGCRCTASSLSDRTARKRGLTLPS